MSARTTCRYRSALHLQRLRRCLGLWVLLVLSGGSGAEPLDEPLKPLPPIPTLAPGRVELGRQLFNDPRLSRNGTRSCASCHRLDKYGADDRAFSMGQMACRLRSIRQRYSMPALISDNSGMAGSSHSRSRGRP